MIAILGESAKFAVFHDKTVYKLKERLILS